MRVYHYRKKERRSKYNGCKWRYITKNMGPLDSCSMRTYRSVYRGNAGPLDPLGMLVCHSISQGKHYTPEPRRYIAVYVWRKQSTVVDWSVLGL